MTEIQQAFEKWITNYRAKGYSLERWNEDWPQPIKEDVRNYSSIATEMDFRIFLAGWEARGKI